MGTIRNRKRAAINPDIIKQGYTNGASSTVLNRASGNWRKLLSYLRYPTNSPERVEAESVLESLNIEYQDGLCNSRTFFDKG